MDVRCSVRVRCASAATDYALVHRFVVRVLAAQYFGCPAMAGRCRVGMQSRVEMSGNGLMLPVASHTLLCAAESQHGALGDYVLAVSLRNERSFASAPSARSDRRRRSAPRTVVIHRTVESVTATARALRERAE